MRVSACAGPGPCAVARQLCAADGAYAALFGDGWPALCDRGADSAPDLADVTARLARYLNSIGPVNQIPIGEAMIAYRERSGDEDSSQTFVPFIAVAGRGGCDSADGGKVTVKGFFRALLVTRHNAHLCLTYLTKEKKQKIMRLGKKKEKGEAEVGRAHAVEGVARLICSAKGSHGAPLKVYIDGTEWNGVKFFQVSTQWQTHVKTFPVATCGAPLAPAET
ncbi:hypothetical protein ACJJTC_005374 [Scirpophaga incertulas]